MKIAATVINMLNFKKVYKNKKNAAFKVINRAAYPLPRDDLPLDVAPLQSVLSLNRRCKETNKKLNNKKNFAQRSRALTHNAESLSDIRQAASTKRDQGAALHSTAAYGGMCRSATPQDGATKCKSRLWAAFAFCRVPKCKNLTATFTS